MRKVSLLVLPSFGLVMAIATVALGQQRGARAADGKPDFTGVWAGPGFTHKVGPGDTDNASVTTYKPENMSPFKPGGEAFMNRRATGNAIVDDPTAACLPNGLTR